MYNPKLLIPIILIFTTVGCQTNKQVKTNSKAELSIQLEHELIELKNIKTNILKQIKDINDAETPYRILVEESQAAEFKQRINQIFQNNQNGMVNLESLKTILESCENQESKWDEYCFKEMPWFGVEPILNVWIKSIEETIKNIE